MNVVRILVAAVVVVALLAVFNQVIQTNPEQELIATIKEHLKTAQADPGKLLQEQVFLKISMLLQTQWALMKTVKI